MGEIKIAIKSLQMAVLSHFQYRADTFIATIAVFLREAASIIVIYLALMKFDNINGWNVNEMLFLFSLLFITYSIIVILFADLRDFSRMIREGRFDRLLVMPRGLLIQLVSNHADVIAAVGHGMLGLVLFIASAGRVGVHWDLKTIMFYISTIIGGVLIQGGMFIIFSALSFYFVETNSIREIFYWNMRKFAGYPISIYNKLIQAVMIYIVPFAFVNYFPAQYLLKKEDMSNYPQVFMYLTPVIGIGVYLLAYVFWRVSIRFYKSTGN